MPGRDAVGIHAPERQRRCPAARRAWECTRLVVAPSLGTLQGEKKEERKKKSKTPAVTNSTLDTRGQLGGGG